MEERINSAGETVASKGRIKLNEKLNHHLIGLKGVYTSYSLQFILPMKSKFSIRLYEYLKSFSNLGETLEIDLEELKDVLLSENDGTRDPNKYKKYSDFYRRVLADAIEEINLHTDMSVSISRTKTFKRNVYAIVFCVKKSEKVAILDKDNNPIDLSYPAESSNSRFEYSDGASKPAFRRRLLQKISLSFTDKKQQAMWETLQNRYASLANKHSKGEKRLDGGNVFYIDKFNEMINDGCFELFITAQVEKYSSRQFRLFMDERGVYNQSAYIRTCITKDVEDWKEFLNRSENTYYETLTLPKEDLLMDIIPPVFKKPEK